VHVFNYVVRLSGYHVLNFIAVDLQLTVQLRYSKLRESHYLAHNAVSWWGATISATTISATTENHIGHTENTYRPQTISATKHMASLLRLIISLLHVYVMVSYSVSCRLRLSALSVVI